MFGGTNLVVRMHKLLSAPTYIVFNRYFSFSRFNRFKHELLRDFDNSKGEGVLAGPFATSRLFSGTIRIFAVTAGPAGPAVTLFLKKIKMMVPLLRFSGLKLRAN